MGTLHYFLYWVLSSHRISYEHSAHIMSYRSLCSANHFLHLKNGWICTQKMHTTWRKAILFYCYVTVTQTNATFPLCRFLHSFSYSRSSNFCTQRSESRELLKVFRNQNACIETATSLSLDTEHTRVLELHLATSRRMYHLRFGDLAIQDEPPIVGWIKRNERNTPKYIQRYLMIKLRR